MPHSRVVGRAAQPVTYIEQEQHVGLVDIL
jgi:hypothetical protein